MSGNRITSDSDARKAMPLATGLLDYFPDALAEVARLSKLGNDKHNPGERLHWSRGKSDDHADCIMRHMIDRGTLDSDGVMHDAKVAWRALAQLQLAMEAQRNLIRAGVAPAVAAPVAIIKGGRVRCVCNTGGLLHHITPGHTYKVLGLTDHDCVQIEDASGVVHSYDKSRFEAAA